MARARQILFRIFYRTSFTVVFLLLLAHISLTPADAIYQSYKASRIFDIMIISGFYILTALLAALVYASRLYTNRSALKDIPKTFLPIEKEDLPGKGIRNLIVDSLTRSAVIAYLAKPRSHRLEVESTAARDRIAALINTDLEKTDGQEPTWGVIAHPGWTSPASSDLPNLHYETVVKELLDLVEAKAVSLAPVDPTSTPNEDGMSMPNERIIEILQRPTGMGMRQYFGKLVSLGVIQNDDLGRSFLELYEQARFAAQPLTEDEFRSLMRLFADLLRSMVPLEIGAGSLDALGSDTAEGHSRSSSHFNFSDRESVRHRPTDSHRHRVSEDSGPSLTKEVSREQRFLKVERTTGLASQISLPSRGASIRSGRSLQRLQTNSSTRSGGSEHSVIRLAGVGDPVDLPYTIQVPR